MTKLAIPILVVSLESPGKSFFRKLITRYNSIKSIVLIATHKRLVGEIACRHHLLVLCKIGMVPLITTITILKGDSGRLKCEGGQCRWLLNRRYWLWMIARQ